MYYKVEPKTLLPLHLLFCQLCLHVSHPTLEYLSRTKAVRAKQGPINVVAEISWHKETIYCVSKALAMDDPPAYDETTKTSRNPFLPDENASSKTCLDDHRWTLQQELIAARTEHLAATVGKVGTVVEGRARAGISTTTLVLVPSGQTLSCKSHCTVVVATSADMLAGVDSDRELIGFPQNEKPVIVVLRGEADELEFWSQAQVIHELDLQLTRSLDVCSTSFSRAAADTPLSVRGPVLRRNPFLKKQPVDGVAAAVDSGKTLDVKLGEVYFRTETTFGLFETIALQAVVIRVVL